DRTRGGALRAPAPAAGWLEGALAGAAVDGDGALGRRLAALQASMRIDPALPATLQAELRPYQREGFTWLMQRAAAGFGACLADDMGLGKTLQSLAVLLARAALGPALVVAPTSVCANWLDETRRFAPSLRAQAWSQALDLSTVCAMDLVVVSYTVLQQNIERFAGCDWATLVADEAQSIKNASAKRTQAVMSVPAGFRIALSGTPIENRLGELWAIMGFANPGLLGSVDRFAQRFVRPIERDRDMRAQRTLRRLIAPFVLRRTKTQVLDDLPPRTEMTLTVTPGAREAAHYESLRREALAAALQAVDGAASAQRQFHVLAQLTRLRRAACDPRLVHPELGLVGAKVEAFAELAAEIVANGHKALVFSQFVDFLGLLRAAADAQELRHQYLDGATPAAERARRIAAFQAGDGDLFLISLKAGGFGLNLTAADYVIIADPWWNPAAEDQASGRAHRIGQARPVTVYRLVTAGSIEERIARLHHDKRALADGILEGTEATAAPDTAALIALIRGD
ncbi:MAG TPA: DEAD/DEAH box helicase, partial [Quisquiliibacterium sp.]|nr:DEAD/DEAH box helicase [Quisquiliibacterium sp.]